MAKKLPRITDFNNIPTEALVPEEEQPYEIPEHWKWVRLGSLITLLSGRDEPLNACNSQGRGIPYLMGASNFNHDEFNFERWIEEPRVISQRGDLLLTVKGTVGKMAVQQEEKVNLSRQVMGLRPLQYLDVKFLQFFLASFIDHIESKAVGLIPGISRNHLLSLPIPLPPLEEQQRTVEYIEQTNSKIDDVIQRLGQYIEQAPSERNKIIEAAMRGLLTRDWRETNASTPDSQSTNIAQDSLVPKDEQPYEIPEHWKWVRLGAVAYFVGGGTPNKTVPNFWNGEISWASVKDLQGSSISTTLDTISEQGLNNSSAKMCDVGDLILATRIVPGKSAIANCPLSINQDLKIVKTQLLLSNFLHLYLNSQASWFELNSSGSTVKGIRITTLNTMPTPLPSLEEQQRIVEKLNRCIEKIDLAVEHVKEARADVEDLRQSLTTAALAGHIPAKK